MESELREPKAPSFNNYLVAAILDGTFKLRNEEEIRGAIHQNVLNLGPGETLADSRSRRSWRNGDNNRDDEFIVSVPADLLFERPPGYKKAREEYESEMAEYKAQLKELREIKETLILKVQIGSDAVLGRLVDQADNLADLRLVNARLLAAPEAGK